MQNGISVYAGLNCTLEENLALIETAASMNLTRLFTSTAVPEAESGSFDVAAMLTSAIEYDFEIILDVTPLTISHFDFEQFTLRLDDGFTTMQTAALSHFRKIMLNASVLTEKTLLQLADANANFDNISALHNFYPHIHTGLDLNYFKNQNDLFHKFGIPVGAFAASKDGRRRPPLEEGLPTLELTRNLPTDLTIRCLSALDTDFIIISDALPTSKECSAAANAALNEVVINIKIINDEPNALNLLSNKFHSRPEISTDLIRAADSRSLTVQSGLFVEPDCNPQPRRRGDITIDNCNFGRYMGEIQVVKNDLPADPRVNLIARVVESDLPLLDFIGSNKAFSFRFV